MSGHGHVLITRPAIEAYDLAGAVEALGFIPVIEPMISLIPVDVALPDLSQYNALIFTSANGARYFSTLSDDRFLPVYCTGDATEAAARSCGWQDVKSASGDAQDLITLLANETLPEGSNLLHPAGEHVAREITAPGLIIERLTIYSAEAVEGFSPALLEILKSGALEAALFFSARTAEIFTELLARTGCTQAVKSTKALCIGDSVVKSLLHLDWQDVQVSARPDREAMLALLKGLP